jgi:DNA polymerase
MLIGEAPGQTEDKKGIPFCGKSGSELTYLYLDKCANIDRRNVYITNLVKCRTNDRDRDPTQGEINACSHILAEEITKVNPKFIGMVGRLSTQWFMPDMKMEKAHGFGYQYSISLFECFIMPLYHPAYGLHNTPMMRHIMEDFRRFGRMVRGDTSVLWRAK